MRAGTRGRHDKGRARLRRYEELAAEAERDHPVDFDEIQIPPGPASATWSWRRTG